MKGLGTWPVEKLFRRFEKLFLSTPFVRLFDKNAGTGHDYRFFYYFLIIFPRESHLSIFTFFDPCRVSMSSFCFISFRDNFLFGFWFLSSLTRSAYLSVFSVCSLELLLGEIFPIITVLQFPMNESFRTRVSFEPLKGLWRLDWSRALMHSFRARRDLLISAPSILVCLLVSLTSAPRSDPARSMKDIFPLVLLPALRSNWRIA